MDDAPLKLILLDRDGVINVDSPDYVKTPGEWTPLPNALEAMAALQRQYRLAVCTNQSGVGRGLFTEDTLAQIHAKLNRLLTERGGHPVQIYYCPHHPETGCTCRKPAPGLLATAMHSHGCRPDETLYVGDSEKDLLAAKAAGCAAALVLTGNGRVTQSLDAASGYPTFSDLAAVAAAFKRPG